MRLGIVTAAALLAGTSLSAAAQRGATSAPTPAPASPASAPAAVGTDALLAGFRDPPGSARPRVWWHWLSGNVSKDGITKDLEWMKRSGIAGAMMFDGDMGAPSIVPHRVTVLSPEWRANLKHAAAEADRLGLEFAMAAGPGWSETGGPWVKPEWGMKKFVWSETRVAGGRPAGRLTPLPSTDGPFQDMPHVDWAGKPQHRGQPFSRDVRVLAFPVPAGDVPLASLKPKLSASAQVAGLERLVDGDTLDVVKLPAPGGAGGPTWVRFAFDAPRTMGALTYVGPIGGRFSTGPKGRIEASDDGAAWRTLRTIVDQAHNPAPQRTFAFAPVSARYFRVVFDAPEDRWPRATDIPLAELAFVPGSRVDMFEDRAGFGVLSDADALGTPKVAAARAIGEKSILDLTDRLRGDGTLDWTAPAGEWLILRTGYSLTGETNHPATPEGTGPEVDKFNAKHVRSHLDAYLKPVIEELGPLTGRRGLGYILTDSWEAGQENWTEDMLDEFRRRRGYDAVPFLPVLSGRLVGSSERSDAFLWDFRRTLADLIAENHYGTITRFAKEHGLGYYGEATGASWPTVADGMLAKSLTDVPMGEFWAIPFGGQAAAYNGVRSDEFPADIVETRSTAHVYGKPLVAAESLTSSLPQWTSTPWKLKWVADRYMAMGVNLLAIHTSPHQPDDTHRPGLTLGPFGQVFTRHETWSGMARPWVDYLARSSYLLQQGAPVDDVLYFYGEGAPSGVPYREKGVTEGVPGYGFDYVNADALMRLATVRDGRIAFPGGASYKVLVLPEALKVMTLPMIERLRGLVEAGAVVIGPKPTSSPSLSSDAAAVKRAAESLWGDATAIRPNAVGRGRVYLATDPGGILRLEGVERDFSSGDGIGAVDVRFAHRRVGRSDVYFLTNQTDRDLRFEGGFRVEGRAPELWHADTGAVEKVSYVVERGRVTVPMRLRPYESTFVVFARPAKGSGERFAEPVDRSLQELDEGWTLSIPGSRPVAARSGSWTTDASPNVRYFSGVGTYSKTISYDPGGLRAGEKVLLRLGAVGELAEVIVNGRSAGVAWQPPYEVDVTSHLRKGSNRIEVKVANVWQNRLVGDRQPGAEPQAWTNVGANGSFSDLAGGLNATTPLVPSGLIGPVRLVAVGPR